MSSSNPTARATRDFDGLGSHERAARRFTVTLTPDLLRRRETQFVVWRPAPAASAPALVNGRRLPVTHPTAWAADWRLLSPPLPAPYDEGDRAAAAVVPVRDGRMVACDPGGNVPDWTDDAPLAGLPANNRTVFLVGRPQDGSARRLASLGGG